jgi:hypothetical protein
LRILIDSRAPEQAKDALSRYGEMIEFHTQGIVYEAISGHPDIFFCSLGRSLVAAPNLPLLYQETLREKGVDFQPGRLPVGNTYPSTARYNAVITEDFLIHRLDITDGMICEIAGEREKIPVTQGYCRCSTLPLNNRNFISSDKGIFHALEEKGLNILLVENKKISLPGFACGFFGGSCGIDNERVFILGSLKHFPGGDRVRDFIEKSGHEIIELIDAPLFDCGSILFV